MSAFTTLRITRARAIEEWLKQNPTRFSNQFLEDFMDKQVEHKLYNVIIVDDDETPNDNKLLY